MVASLAGRIIRRLLALAVGGTVAVGGGELLLRGVVGPPRLLGMPYFRDADGKAFDIATANSEALRRGLCEPLPLAPRPRNHFAPGAHFYMCYGDAPRLDADWLDDRGCVEVKINRFGLRERDEIAPDNKAPDELRIACLGDSFTFGWGVRIEQCWTRLLESELRRTHGNVRTINGGLAFGLCVDEYRWGLEGPMGAFAPDVVVVSIYGNDLVPSMGLCLHPPPPAASGFLLLDYLRATVARDPLDLDPAIDWVQLALQLDEPQGTAMGMYGPDKPFTAMWSQGAPQAALTAMRDWCRSHNSTLVVALWPFLQGFGPTERYPLQKLNDLVIGFCKEQGIDCLDLTPALAIESASRLWVTPFDKHANPRAHRLAAPALAAFVGQHLRG